MSSLVLFSDEFLLMSGERRHLEDMIILQMNSRTQFIQMEKEAEKQHQAIPSRDDEENCVCFTLISNLANNSFDE